MSTKIKLKNIFTGVLIGAALMFLAVLVFYFFVLFLPEQKAIREQKRMDEIERIFFERRTR